MAVRGLDGDVVRTRNGKKHLRACGHSPVIGEETSAGKKMWADVGADESRKKALEIGGTRLDGDVVKTRNGTKHLTERNTCGRPTPDMLRRGTGRD